MDSLWRVLGENGSIVTVSMYAVIVSALAGTFLHLYIDTASSQHEARRQEQIAVEQTIRRRSNTLAAASDQFFREGDYGTALALGVAALPNYLAKDSMAPEKTAVKGTFNAYSNLVEIESVEVRDDRSLFAMYHPSGKQYVVWSKRDRKIDFNDLNSKSTAFSISCWSCKPNKASFSGDGTLFVSERGVDGQDAATTNIGALFDASTGTVVKQFVGHKDWIDSISISRDGRRVVTASNDKTAKIWRVDGSAIATIPLSYKMKKFAGFISGADFDSCSD